MSKGRQPLRNPCYWFLPCTGLHSHELIHHVLPKAHTHRLRCGQATPTTIRKGEATRNRNRFTSFSAEHTLIFPKKKHLVPPTKRRNKREREREYTQTLKPPDPIQRSMRSPLVTVNLDCHCERRKRGGKEGGKRKGKKRKSEASPLRDSAL